MKERIKGAFTKRKILHFLKMALFVVALSDRKSTRLNSSHRSQSRMPSSA